MSALPRKLQGRGRARSVAFGRTIHPNASTSSDEACHIKHAHLCVWSHRKRHDQRHGAELGRKMFWFPGLITMGAQTPDNAACARKKRPPLPARAGQFKQWPADPAPGRFFSGFGPSTGPTQNRCARDTSDCRLNCSLCSVLPLVYSAYPVNHTRAAPSTSRRPIRPLVSACSSVR